MPRYRVDELFRKELHAYPPMGSRAHVYDVQELPNGNFRLTIDGKPGTLIGSPWRLAHFRRGYLDAVYRRLRRNQAPYPPRLPRERCEVFPMRECAIAWQEGHDLATGNDDGIDPTGASSYCNERLYPPIEETP